ncbi:hypothetical protein [Heyndrickxia oleronia]|jgi:hypothetical protein|uniref:hypothetical protein n=1 Tax=Heyndrickxia oleronia TaxID=38875 RepID=UPI0024324D38|nr:hypothetical protein [Heyndrickxia oleronia]MCI1590376.1 hypothetical protein [Heyndrickxia oleronia]MCI1611362.1 hypothetical protein [Heyndrickxia oleronia]MCI1742805.1 hypothetical protein [Heyndrickxia oleronia]MCI1763110.1 hypothetical protein [Heyndrickxia oleronia]
MRLTKTAYYYGDKGEYLGNDQFGRPVYGDPKMYPFEMEIEPYSTELARTQYGIVVEVNYRLYTYPNTNLKLETKINYNGSKFMITKVWDYDRHYELLIKKLLD